VFSEQTKEKTQTEEAQIEVGTSQQVPGAITSWKKQRTDSQLSLQRACGLQTQLSVFQNCKRMHFCCVKSPSLCSFVTAAAAVLVKGVDVPGQGRRVSSSPFAFKGESPPSTVTAALHTLCNYKKEVNFSRMESRAGGRGR
jgi:hypothetical protein